MTIRILLLVGGLLEVGFPLLAPAQSEAPSYRWTVVQSGNVGGTLTKKISIAPASIRVSSGSVRVWLLTENYRPSDEYREKYYGEFAIDCRTGYAREITSVMDRFGRGKPPRYGKTRPGFNDYDDVLAVKFGTEAAVLGDVARKHCPK